MLKIKIKNDEKLVHAEYDIKPFVHSYFMHQVYLQLWTLKMRLFV